MPTPQFLQPPVAGLPNPSDYTFQGLPNIMSTGAAQQRTEMMAPFLDLAKQQQESALAEQLFQQKEYQDPMRQAGRRAEARKTITEADIGERTKEFKILEEKLKADVAPYKSAEEIAKFKELVRQHADAPAMQAQTFAGQFYPKLKDTPGPLQQSVYQSEVLPAIEQMYPSLKGKLPQQLDMSLLEGSYVMSVEIAKFKQEQSLKREEFASEEKRTDRSAGATVEAARLRAAADLAGHEAQYGTRGQRELNAKEKILGDRIKNDTELQGMQTQFMTTKPMLPNGAPNPAYEALQQRRDAAVARVTREMDQHLQQTAPPADAPVADAIISYNEKRSGKKYVGPRPAKTKDVTDAKNWK